MGVNPPTLLQRCPAMSAPNESKINEGTAQCQGGQGRHAALGHGKWPHHHSEQAGGSCEQSALRDSSSPALPYTQPLLEVGAARGEKRGATASQSSRQGLFAQLSAGRSEQNRYLWVALAPGGTHGPVLLGRVQTTTATVQNSRAQQSPAGPPRAAREVALPAAGQLPWAVPHRASPTHSSAPLLLSSRSAQERAAGPPAPGCLFASCHCTTSL